MTATRPPAPADDAHGNTDVDDPQREVVAFLGTSDCAAFRVDASDGQPRSDESLSRFTSDFEPAPEPPPESAPESAPESRFTSEPTPTIVDTHAARLFLGKRIVCKIKRAVAYSYLDTTTLDSRRRLCERELELNRPDLPDIYIDVVPITRESNGRLAVKGVGKVIEWVLRMHRFEQSLVLDEIANAGRLDVKLAGRLGASIAHYHASRPRDLGGDGHARLREVIDELDAEFSLLGACLSRTDSTRFATEARHVLDRKRTLLDRRARAGFVRRCHGDLHLRNLLLHEGEPVPFDALEFDERLATTDVLYDLAFLIMDLGHRALPRQQNEVLNEYLLHAELENAEGLALLPLFLATRAAVRAMTSAQAATHDSSHGAALSAEASRYLAASLDYLTPRPAILVAIGGLSGSGKSTVAAALPTRIAYAPGAVLLGSDAERKSALGVDSTERLAPECYTASSAKDNYRRLSDKAGQALSAGFSVVIDATWLDTDKRVAVASLARQADVPFVGLWLDAPASILRQRIASRQGDVSDATVAVLDAQLQRVGSLPANWQRIDAGGTKRDTLHHCLLEIVRVRGSQGARNSAASAQVLA